LARLRLGYEKGIEKGKAEERLAKVNISSPVVCGAVVNYGGHIFSTQCQRRFSGLILTGGAAFFVVPRYAAPAA